MDVKEKLTEILSIYKNATLKVFTTNGLIMTIVLILLFMATYLVNVSLNATLKLFQSDVFAILIAIVSAILTMALWWVLGVKYAPKLGALLTEKKIMNILFTKGDFHYFEKVDSDDLRIMPGTIIAKFINLILSWFAVTAFLLGFLLSVFPGSTTADKLTTFFTATPGLTLEYILKLLIVFVLSPLLMTITVPIPWMLLDTRLKAYNSSAKINSFVGRAVQSRLNGLFAVGGIGTLLLQGLNADNIILAVVFIFGFLAFPTILVVTLYNMLFQVKYYESFLKEIPVPFGTTRIDSETKFSTQEPTNTSDNGSESNDNPSKNSEDNNSNDS